MSFKTRYWLNEQYDLIQTVKRHPIIYAGDYTISRKQYKANLDSVWEDIAKFMGQSSRILKRQWKEIKTAYVKLKIMINSGIISEEIVHRHTTSKYLDGALSFLDPYISELTKQEKLSSISKRIDDIFGIGKSNVIKKNKDNNTVAANERDKNVSETLGEVQSVSDSTRVEPTSDVGTQYNRRSSNADQRKQLGLESELIIEDIKTENGIEDEVTEECDNNPEHILPDNPMSTKDDTTIDTNAMIAVGNDEPISDERVKNFCNELGNVICAELTVEKQKILQHRINALLVKTLDLMQ